MSAGSGALNRGSFVHRGKRTCSVEGRRAKCVRRRDDGILTVAYHSPRVGARVLPAGQPSTWVLLGVVDQRLNHVADLRRDDRQQRHFRTVVIPTSEVVILRESVGLVYLIVKTYVLPVRITEHTRMDEGMVQGGIKHRLLVVGSASNLNGVEACVPRGSGIACDACDVPALILAIKVFLRVLHADERQPDLDVHDRIGGGIEDQVGPALRALA